MRGIELAIDTDPLREGLGSHAYKALPIVS